MNTQSQRQRINSRAAAVLYKAIDSLPLLLADSEPAQAAAIAADLVKFQLTLQHDGPEPGETLDDIIKRCIVPDKDTDQPSAEDQTPGLQRLTSATYHR